MAGTLLNPRVALSCVSLVVVLQITGCRAIRAQVGYGIGIGGGVKIPALAHTTVGVGYYERAGIDYGEIEEEQSRLVAGSGFMHYEKGCTRTDEDHVCFSVLPVLTQREKRKHDPHWAALEVEMFAIFVNLRLGLNPAYWFTPVDR